ncbi:MAG: class I SAM-dependent methyltransferase [Thermoleophilia bacterium]
MDHADWDRRYTAAELVWTARPNRFLVAEALPLAPGRALDLAAGEGRNAVWLAERGWTVTAVDFSAVGLEKGRAMASHRGVVVDFVQGDVTEWRAEEAVFDLVCVLYLQVPAAARGAAMRAAAEALAPGGALVVVAHDIRNLTDGVGGPQDPSVLYGPEDVLADLDGLPGLRAERAERVLRPVGGRDAIDTLVRVRRA